MHDGGSAWIRHVTAVNVAARNGPVSTLYSVNPNIRPGRSIPREPSATTKVAVPGPRTGGPWMSELELINAVLESQLRARHNSLPNNLVLPPSEARACLRDGCATGGAQATNVRPARLARNSNPVFHLVKILVHLRRDPRQLTILPGTLRMRLAALHASLLLRSQMRHRPERLGMARAERSALRPACPVLECLLASLRLWTW
jgi:hypothetical protein